MPNICPFLASDENDELRECIGHDCNFAIIVGGGTRCFCIMKFGGIGALAIHQHSECPIPTI